jgi:hypothetical protein
MHDQAVTVAAPVLSGHFDPVEKVSRYGGVAAFVVAVTALIYTIL